MAEGTGRRWTQGWVGLARKLSSFASLDPEDRFLFIEAWLRIATERLVARRLRTDEAADPRMSAASPPAVPLDRLERLFLLAERHHPGQVSCLPRSRALRGFLARRGHPARVRIGVRRERGHIDGHAWTEVEGRPIGEGPLVITFCPLAFARERR